MKKRLLNLATFAVLTAVAPSFADLVVTNTLGTLAGGITPLSGSTVGKANNAWVYNRFSNTATTVWGNGEYVYRFELSKPAFLYLTDLVEPDADGTFPDPNHDYLLMNTLATFSSDNTAASTTNPNFTSFAGLPEGDALAAVTDTMGPSTAGSSANIGIFRQATNNPKGLYQPGTYYVAVDSRSGTVNSHGQSNALPPGNFSAKLNVAYLDEIAKPHARPSTPTEGAQITGQYNPGEVKMVKFNYTGGALTLNTEGNTLNESGGDTFLALYDNDGALIKFNDDVGFGPAWSQISIADGEIPVGTYYLGMTEYKAVANSAFDLSVYPAAVGASGTFVINGLSGALPGDTNVDTDVDFDDLLILAQNYGSTGKYWEDGDFTLDAVVNFDDLLALAQNYGTNVALVEVPEGASAQFAADWKLAMSMVPEPTSISLLALSSVALRRRRFGRKG